MLLRIDRIKRILLDLIRWYWVILLAPFLLLLPLWTNGQVLFWGTPGLQFVPWWWQAWQQVSRGIVPLWNPLNGMGAPLLANYQMAFFYPPNWLLLPLAGIFGPAGIAWGYSFLAGAHLAWAGVGMAVFLRQLNYKWLAQVVGGLAYGLSGYLVGRLGFFSMIWVAAWLPWMLFYGERLATWLPSTEGRKRLSFSTGLTACAAMILLAGHAQLAWYGLLLGGAWMILRGWQAGGISQAARGLVGYSLSIGLGAGIAAVQLVPTAEYLVNSFRASSVQYDEAMRYSFWPWRFITLFSPDFFGNPGRGDYWGYASYWEDHVYAGMIPLLLGLASLALVLKGIFRKVWRAAHREEWQRTAVIWVGMGITFALALGQNTPVFPFLYEHVPTFNMFQAPARYLIWAALGLPLLAAVGISHWRCPTGRGLYWFRLGTAGAFAITLGAGLAWLLMPDTRLTFIRSTALAGIWLLGFGLLTLVLPWMS